VEVKIIPTRTLFLNEDDNYGVYGVDVHQDDVHKVELNKYGNITINGISPKLNNGEEYIAKLRKDTNSKYPNSYIIESIRQERPVTVEDQKRFFEMILSPHQLENIFKVYEGQDIIELVKTDTLDFTAIKGMGEKTYEKMREKVLMNLEMSELLIFLSKHNIRYNMIQKLIKHYKNPQIVIDKIESNPYILTEVKGIGFHKADAIAKAMGYDMHSPNRIHACVGYIIAEENANGHSWVDEKLLVNRAVDYLTIKRDIVRKSLIGNIEGVLKIDERFTRTVVYEAESYIAEKMLQLKSQSKKVFESEHIDEFLDDYTERNGVELEENQRQFFHDWNENAVLMLVGGGGTGKSWLQRILLELVKKKKYRSALLAPTGRAAKVMSNYSGMPASTIHRKIGVYGEDEGGNGEIQEDIVIIDETSMCDIFILSKLFNSITNENVRVLFVGDDFQLPSVGVGNFLYDVIHSELIKVSKLTKVFRQENGGILNVSTDVKEGRKFLNPSADGRIVFGKDCVFWMTDSEYVKDGVLVNYKKVLSRYSHEDIAILTPTHKGRLGTVSLNRELQKIANPPSSNKKQRAVGKKGDETIYRVGDLVMNLVNSYEIPTEDGGVADVFNGDIGTIIDINEADKVFVVEFDGIKVLMKFNIILSNLTHAWATTIHKAQGSQMKVVIVIVDKSSKFQLNANLLYTGLSRAQEYELVLGQAETINVAMKKFANMERRSFLQELLANFDRLNSGVN
jgi:exodeoxyribonuclease V alpha subunit